MTTAGTAPLGCATAERYPSEERSRESDSAAGASILELMGQEIWGLTFSYEDYPVSRALPQTYGRLLDPLSPEWGWQGSCKRGEDDVTSSLFRQ